MDLRDLTIRLRYIFPQLIKNKIKLLFYKKPIHKHLFILSPPHSGSTLLNAIISTSPNVSTVNTFGLREGMWLIGDPNLTNFDYRWDESTKFDWPRIRSIWNKHWDLTKPVLLEKSPFNIFRSSELEKTFNPAYFILLYRNPYAHFESTLKRRFKRHELDTDTKTAEFTIRCLKHQLDNKNKLKNILLISYEELTDHTETTVKKIVDFIPELGIINTNKYADQFKGTAAHINMDGIYNMNEIKIKNIKPESMIEINSVFSKHIDLLKTFGYNIVN